MVIRKHQAYQHESSFLYYYSQACDEGMCICHLLQLQGVEEEDTHCLPEAAEQTRHCLRTVALPGEVDRMGRSSVHMACSSVDNVTCVILGGVRKEQAAA